MAGAALASCQTKTCQALKRDQQRLAAMTAPVKLIYFTQELECPTCKETHELLKALADLSDRLSLEVYNFVTDKETAEKYEIDKIPADQAYIGSCTNGRIEDLRIAASILKDRKVAERTRALVVPATTEIWKQANREGLFDIFSEDIGNSDESVRGAVPVMNRSAVVVEYELYFRPTHGNG